MKPDRFPVEAYSYSLFSKFCTNPVLFRIQHLNKDTIETTKSANSVLGNAVHFGLKCFLGGDEQYPVPNDDGEALKIALDATLKYLSATPDGFIQWTKNVATRGRLEELALKSITGYIREWDRGRIKSVVMVEQKLMQSVALTFGNKDVMLPIPLVGLPDCVYVDTQDRLCIDDHKTVFRFSDPDAIDGGKLIQAGMYYLLVYAHTGRAPYSMTFREYKVSENKDGGSQSKEYTMVYAEMPMIFDLLFRLYEDVTNALLGKMVYVPNILAMFDRDVALLAYIYRLDEPDVVEKEKRRSKVEDVAVIMQKKMARARNLQRFMEAKANLFTSHISLNYDKMQPHEQIKYKMMEHGMALNFHDRVEGLAVELYRFDPSVGIKMATLEKYKKDVEQVLSASGVRILAPIPGTNLVGFEVPKKKRAFVDLKDATKTEGLEVPFGVDIYGVQRDVDVRDLPHLLIGGTTGSGKSTFLNAMLSTLSQRPTHLVRFALFDPKLVELADFQSDAHTDIYCEEAKDIAIALKGYTGEMDRRYKVFKEAKVKNLEQYRKKGKTDIPYVVVVVDEFGDLLMRGDGWAGEIKQHMIRLAQKARAAGIHLVITTQRPSSKVVDGLIKANFPARVAFKTATRLESEIILDRAGAEGLLGKGDLLLSGAGTEPERLQGFRITE